MLSLIGTLIISYLSGLAQAQDTYDFVIVGGGTCGLVLANRLSEDPNVSVAVIEAGDSVKNNNNVTQIPTFLPGVGTAIDWAYQGVPQEYTDGRILTFSAGKALGGSSAINGAVYLRASRALIDSWETLGNEGWNWESLWPYYLKSEHLYKPTPDLVTEGVNYEAYAHGLGGHVGVGWSNITTGGNAHLVINDTYQRLGINYNKDQATGNMHGFSLHPSTIDSDLEVRADAARCYLYPIEERPNLHVLTNTLANSIEWEDMNVHHNQGLRARGVRVSPIDGCTTKSIWARQEVILSAGSFKSPGVLERSGVGNPEILNRVNIASQIDLPAVGNGLIDQANVVVLANTSTNWTGFTPFVAYATALDLFKANTSSVAAYVRNQITTYATAIAIESNNATTIEALEKQLHLHADLAFDKGVPLAEILIINAGPSQILGVSWQSLPFSRGSVHISSLDASVTPEINPNYFMLDWDAMVQAATSNFVRTLFHTPPLADFVDSTTVDSNNEFELDDWLPFLKQTYSSNSHSVSTCAMRSRELGGVVSPDLVVYGTQNVRVVDASVLPLQLDGHPTSTLYALAERAADKIIKKWSKIEGEIHCGSNQVDQNRQGS